MTRKSIRFLFLLDLTLIIYRIYGIVSRSAYFGQQHEEENEMPDLNPKEMHTVLDEVYPKDEIFILGVHFNDEELSAEVRCCVPSGVFYTAKPIPYVTTENYVRCLSQTSYLLGEHILTEGLIETDVDAESFVRAAADYELYYRSISMVFHKRVPRGAEFVLKLSLKNAREIKRFEKDFLLFTFSNERTVISGEMSFVQMV